MPLEEIFLWVHRLDYALDWLPEQLQATRQEYYGSLVKQEPKERHPRKSAVLHSWQLLSSTSEDWITNDKEVCLAIGRPPILYSGFRL